MIFTLTLGGDERGWSHLSFEREPDPGWKDGPLCGFTADVDRALDRIERDRQDRRLLDPDSVTLFVMILEAGGYRISSSVAIIDVPPERSIGLEFTAPSGWKHGQAPPSGA